MKDKPDKFTKSGPGRGKDRAPGKPTLSDYRKAADSAKYLLDLIVDAMERKRKVGHRALTKNDTLFEYGEATKSYWFPFRMRGAGEKFKLCSVWCCGVSPAVDSVREIVDFVLGAVEK